MINLVPQSLKSAVIMHFDRDSTVYDSFHCVLYLSGLLQKKKIQINKFKGTLGATTVL